MPRLFWPLVEAGLTDIGENYANELVTKAEHVPSDDASFPAPLVWHFLGAIQRNKVPRLAPIVGLWQSVARAEESTRIARFAPGAAVLVEVETTGQAGRNGCPPQAVGELVAHARDDGLDVRGPDDGGGPGRRRRAIGVHDGAPLGRRVRPRGAFHGDDRRPRGGRAGRHDHGADRPCAVRRAPGKANAMTGNALTEA